MSYAFMQECGDGLSFEEAHELAVQRAQLVCKSPDRTKQADKESCDINVIMRRNLESGILPQTRMVPIYADISEMGSLQDALQVMDEARSFFSHLPAATREAFGNSPAEFVAASTDPAQRDKFVKLGLVPAIEAPPESGGASSTVPT